MKRRMSRWVILLLLCVLTVTYAVGCDGKTDINTGEKDTDVEQVGSETNNPPAVGVGPETTEVADSEADHVLVFSNEDKKLELDKQLKYEDEDLKLLEEADRLYEEGKYSEADKLFDKIAKKSAAWQRDPLLLMKWGMTQLKLDMLLDAQAKLEIALAKAGDNKQLKEEVIKALGILIKKMPDDDNAYIERKRDLLRQVYESDKSNAEWALEYVAYNLEQADTLQGVPFEDLMSNFNILESIAEKDWGKSVSRELLADAYTKLVSLFTRTPDAREHIDIIKNCVDKAEAIGGEGLKNPFMFYMGGLLKQNEGKMEDAIRLVQQAENIAKNNKDIDFWLKANDPGHKSGVRLLKTVFLKGLNLAGDKFDTHAGTMWLDNDTILTTVCKDAGSSQAQRLIKLNIDTMEYDEIYRGEFLQLKFITPDKRYVVLNDNGLKLLDLENKNVLSVSGKGYQCSLSPDGRTIAYTEEGIWLYDIHNGSKRKIDDGRDSASPIWFPDGENLLYVGDLGGEELGDGAGHLQSIVKKAVKSKGGKEIVNPDWKSKFHYIDWILPGDIVHVEEGWDDGFESIILDLYDGGKKAVGSLNDGKILTYKAGYDYVFTVDNNGVITKLDVMGRALSRYKFGDIWGDSFGVAISHMSILPDSDKLMFLYRTSLNEKMSLWTVDMEFERAEFIAEVSMDAGENLLVSPGEDKVIVGNSADALEIYNIN